MGTGGRGRSQSTETLDSGYELQIVCDGMVWENIVVVVLLTPYPWPEEWVRENIVVVVLLTPYPGPQDGRVWANIVVVALLTPYPGPEDGAGVGEGEHRQFRGQP